MGPTNSPGETARLRFRRLEDSDAAFVRELVTDEAFFRFIGDKGVRTADDARRFLRESPWTRYDPPGLGMQLVVRREDHQPIGVCGLLQRPHLPAPDLGFAFLPGVRSQGYAREAADAVLAWGRDRLRINHILAITVPDNVSSIRLLERLGFIPARQPFEETGNLLVLSVEFG